jgi:hypothetical protein
MGKFDTSIADFTAAIEKCESKASNVQADQMASAKVKIQVLNMFLNISLELFTFLYLSLAVLFIKLEKHLDFMNLIISFH